MTTLPGRAHGKGPAEGGQPKPIFRAQAEVDGSRLGRRPRAASTVLDAT